jgi:hypothetical protein
LQHDDDEPAAPAQAPAQVPGGPGNGHGHAYGHDKPGFGKDDGE